MQRNIKQNELANVTTGIDFSMSANLEIRQQFKLPKGLLVKRLNSTCIRHFRQISRC